MTTSQEIMTDAAHRGQEAFTSALQIWADSVQKFAPTSQTKLRGTVEAVDTMFDFADHMLASQREFTKILLGVTASAATKATTAAQHAAKDMQDAAKDMQDVAKEATPTRDTHDSVNAKTTTVRKS
jgi:predicted protein tyrosine phosphatase